MEELYAYILLKDAGFPVEQACANYIDAWYSEDQENELAQILLFEKDAENAVLYVRRGVDPVGLDKERIGKSLMALLKQEYLTCTSYEHFARRAYSVWTLLSESMQKAEPFHHLSYANDLLKDGDEKRSREIYEEAFDFYRS